LESILCTEELLKRPWRPPDREKENSALVALVSALANSPQTILQTLVDKVLVILRAESAGLSLLTKDGKKFYWAAIAGAWQPHIGGGTPRDFGPCGDVLDRNIPIMAQSIHRHRAERCLLLGVKRTSRLIEAMSAFDPKRTFCLHGRNSDNWRYSPLVR
jgi:hypothetical protein